MLEMISKGFKNARLKLKGKSELTEDNIKAAVKDVRISLLEADVEISVVRSFINTVKTRCIGEVVKVTATHKSGEKLKVKPADHFIRICHEELVNLMGPVDTNLVFSETASPTVIMMVGLQGSGKTTTTGKLAKRLKASEHKPLLVAADIYRPAAIDQLKILGERLEVPVFSIPGMNPVDLCKYGVAHAKQLGCDVVLFDTAGRLAVDNALMGELQQIKMDNDPHNIFFVCDSMIGQDSVKTAKSFDQLLDFTGFILTKLDGDTRGGAALSIKSVTGKPIKFLGMGEGLDALEDFRPEGLADRILGFGDVVGLMNDFERVIDKDTAETDARKMLQGQFSFDDFVRQIEMIKKMGSLRSLFERMPGFGALLEKIPKEALDDRELERVKAIIQSMTKQERREPDVINESRIRRIAKGCGRTEKDVNDLYERFLQTRTMMGQLGQSGMMQQMMQGQNPFAGGGNPFGGMPGMGGFPGVGPTGQHTKSGGSSRRNALAEARRRRRSGKNKKRS
ncbi:MAG: signal recognition particle protein [Myxococcota bacterium]|nr:signal recognition particle protein [Myxococcota bacterium]